MGSVRITRLELLWPHPLHKSWRGTSALQRSLRLCELQKEQQRERLLLVLM